MKQYELIFKSDGWFIGIVSGKGVALEKGQMIAKKYQREVRVREAGTTNEFVFKPDGTLIQIGDTREEV